MSSIHEDLPAYPQMSGIWRGVVAVAPISVNAPMRVTLTDMPDALQFPVARWQGRGTDLPIRGDEVLVIFDNRREPWVAVWWPF